MGLRYVASGSDRSSSPLGHITCKSHQENSGSPCAAHGVDSGEARRSANGLNWHLVELDRRAPFARTGAHGVKRLIFAAHRLLALEKGSLSNVATRAYKRPPFGESNGGQLMRAITIGAAAAAGNGEGSAGLIPGRQAPALQRTQHSRLSRAECPKDGEPAVSATPLSRLWDCGLLLFGMNCL